MDSKAAPQERPPPAGEQALSMKWSGPAGTCSVSHSACSAGPAFSLATLILVIKGGPNVGAHLGLLNQFFPGYTVTFLGSFVGLFYGFLVGYISGWIVATVYNGVVYFRLR